MVILPRILPWSVSMKCLMQNVPTWLYLPVTWCMRSRQKQLCVRYLLVLLPAKFLLLWLLATMTMNRIRRVPNYMMSFALFLIIFSRTEVRPIHPTTCLHCRLPTVIVMQLCCIVWIRTPTPGCRMWKDMPGLPLIR
mgnify:CR=1 FL=1